ncbi:MAG TPA: flagellar biosynthesis anti-sigma factor FlgM [Terriglobales bacterium]|nr:flagellar biosynthesis anti-sigma factor FlgM [Terriglobales bacterium]
MRIDLNSSTSTSGPQIEKPTSSHSAQPSNAAIVNQSAFSESDMSTGRLAAAALNSPEVRMDRVRTLKSQIESGTYQVSPSHVAGSMTEQMRVRAS